MNKTEIVKLIENNDFGVGSDSINRVKLIEGIELIRKRISFQQAMGPEGINTEDYGGWISKLINKKLKGNVDGLKIIWNKGSEEEIKWDPITGQFD